MFANTSSQYSSNRSNEAVMGDTKLFQEGELGKVPHGYVNQIIITKI